MVTFLSHSLLSITLHGKADVNASPVPIHPFLGAYGHSHGLSESSSQMPEWPGHGSWGRRTGCHRSTQGPCCAAQSSSPWFCFAILKASSRGPGWRKIITSPWDRKELIHLQFCAVEGRMGKYFLHFRKNKTEAKRQSQTLSRMVCRCCYIIFVLILVCYLAFLFAEGMVSLNNSSNICGTALVLKFWSHSAPKREDETHSGLEFCKNQFIVFWVPAV